jgi:Tfp pilus assembly protein PilV
VANLHKQQGFSLLEVQLALGLLALGFGLVSHLYLMLGQQARLTYERQQAVSVLQQMVTVLPYYHQHLTVLQSLSTSEVSVPVSTCDLGQVCTAQQMLVSHWGRWQQLLTHRLGASELSFSCSSQCEAGDDLVLAVNWRFFNRPQSVALDWQY